MSATTRTRGTGFVGFDPPRPRPRWGGRPLVALVAQIKARVEKGEDPDDVLDHVDIRQPAIRAAYLAAAGINGDAPC